MRQRAEKRRTSVGFYSESYHIHNVCYGFTLSTTSRASVKAKLDDYLSRASSGNKRILNAYITELMKGN